MRSCVRACVCVCVCVCVNKLRLGGGKVAESEKCTNFYPEAKSLCSLKINCSHQGFFYHLFSSDFITVYDSFICQIYCLFLSLHKVKIKLLTDLLRVVSLLHSCEHGVCGRLLTVNRCERVVGGRLLNVNRCEHGVGGRFCVNRCEHGRSWWPVANCQQM